MELLSDLSDRCLELSKPNYWNLAPSIFILVGILVSYLPQHYRIIKRKSSEGLSPYFVLLGATSGTSGFANILAQPVSRADLACCKVNSGFACFAGLLGILQIGVQWMCFTIILLLFLLYFPRASPLAPPHHPTTAPSFRTAITVTAICIVHAIIQAILNLVIAARFPEHLQAYANAIGIIATVLAAIQYLPQIWTTWHLKTVASLSIPMMCIQTPGSYIWAASLAGRLGWGGWSTWGIFLVTGVLQGVLLVMGLSFEWRDRKLRKKGMPVPGEEVAVGGDRVIDARTRAENDAADERTALLGGRDTIHT